jgi:hypothetical protein
MYIKKSSPKNIVATRRRPSISIIHNKLLSVKSSEPENTNSAGAMFESGLMPEIPEPEFTVK